MRATNFKQNSISFLIFLAIVSATLPASGQIDQLRRARERMDRTIRASEEAERRELEEAKLPVPKAARMNIDVQAVLSTGEFKTFAEAKPRAAARVTDGDALWLYLKFTGKLGDYVLTTRDPEDASRLRYTLYAEFGPRGDVTAIDQTVLRFLPEELAQTEVKLALAPGLFGRNRSVEFFLRAAALARPGQWNSEVRISNKPGYPRSTNDHLATSPILLDLRGGNARYRAMAADYDSIIIRGSSDKSIVPRPGTFFNLPIRDQVTEMLRRDGTAFSEIYFAGDDWMEARTPEQRAAQARRTVAVFPYRTGEKCMYGIAVATQAFDGMAEAYAPATIEITKDIVTPCPK